MIKRTGLFLAVISLPIAGVAWGTSRRAQEPVLSSQHERLLALHHSLIASEWGGAVEEGDSLLAEASVLSEKRSSEIHFALGFAKAMRAGETGAGAPAAAPNASHPVAPSSTPPEPPVLGADYVAAAEDFTSARALAGPGRLRSFATYDLGLVSFLRGDLWRATLPEIAPAGGQPVPSAVPHGPAGPGARDEAPDPLEEARVAYLEAKASLIEALRADWRDEDTRANLELIQRRLAQLDEIEKEREKQKGPDQEDASDEETEEGEDGEEDQDSEEGGEEQQDPSEGDQEEEGDPKDGSEEKDPSDETSSESETTDNDVREGEELPEGEGEARSMAEPDSERHLTREEVIRLLDKLAEIEAEGETVTGARARGRRARVDRDW